MILLEITFEHAQYAIASGIVAAIISAMGSMGAAGISMAGNKKKTKAVEGLAMDQFEFYQNLTKKREAQRDVALKNWGETLKNTQAYKTPESVNKYVDLMFSLGGELSALRDPTNKSSINLNDYRGRNTEYGQLSTPDIDFTDPEWNNYSLDADLMGSKQPRKGPNNNTSGSDGSGSHGPRKERIIPNTHPGIPGNPGEPKTGRRT